MGSKKNRPSWQRILLTILAGAAGIGVVGIALFALYSLPARDSLAVQSASAAGPLRLEFPEPMDHQSVEENLSLPGGVTGALAWEKEALVFTPASPLLADELYAFTLDQNAKTASGDPIGKPLEFRFRITGNPVVSARIPTMNAAGIATDARITIVFDRPVIALAEVGEAPNPPGWERVQIEPSTSGRWRWLSTYAVEFVPDRGLTPSQLYTVRVPAGIETVNGEKTERDETWSFETLRPSVISSSPEDGFDATGPMAPLTLTFDSEVDLRSAAKHIELLALERTQPSSVNADGPLPVKAQLEIASVLYGESEDDEGELREDRKIVVVTPKNALPFASAFALRVTPGTLALGGGDLGSSKTFVARFSTAGPLKVEEAAFADGALRIRFSNPVSSGSLATMIALDPVPEGFDELTFEPNSWEGDKLVVVYPALTPGQKYTLTIKAGAKDIFGQKLGADSVTTFTAPDLRPEVSMDSKGQFGVFERSKTPVFLLRSVNVASLEVDFARLSLEQFLKIRKEHGDDTSYVPALESFSEHRHWSLKPENKKNAWSVLPLDLQELLKSSLDGGIYAITVRAPGFVRPWDNQPGAAVQYFSLTDTALTLKYSGKKALLWAVNMQTGAPVSGADVEFRSLDGSTVSKAKTDAQGFLDTGIDISALAAGSQSWQPEFWVTATKGRDFSFVSSLWTDPVLTGDFGMWWDFQSPTSPPLRPIVSLQTDRPVYRPGDTVSFKGTVRLKDWDGELNLPEKKHSVEVVIQDPQGTEVLRRGLPFSEFGTFSAELPTTDASALGAYSVLATIRPDGETFGQLYAGSFQVLAYRKPEYRVELTPREEEVSAGDTVTVDLLGSYYFGAPLSGAKVKWRAQMQDYFFNKVTDDWYAFAPEESWCWWDCPGMTELFTEGTGTLSAAGTLSITIPARIAEEDVSQILTVEADITDASNQIVSGRTSVIVHKAQAYVGIRALDYVVTPNSSASMKIITVDPAGKPLPRKLVTLTLAARTWNTIRRKNVDGAFYYENEPKDEVVRTLTVTTDTEGKAVAKVPVDRGGQFVVKAEVSDNSGRSSQASTSIYAWSSAYVNWPRQNSDRIDLVADKPVYAVGDTAKLLAKSPFQGENVQALVTVERENVITRKVIPVLSNAQSIEIPITEDLIPNAYVSVVILKPRIGETFDENGKDTGAPAFKIGYARLKVETTKKELSVVITPDRERYLPGETVRAKVTVKDATGKPAKAEFSFAAVDASVLALTGYVRPDLVSTFYSEHGLGVYTAPMLQYLIDRYKPGSKGGGGGLEERERSDFQDTAVWKPSIVTDENGAADISFALPDNLTTWQFLAVAGTKESQFGAVEKEVIATKRVILRPVRPRFAVTGDTVTLKAIVQNFLPERQTFEVSLSGSGFTIQGGSVRSVAIAPDGQTIVTFPVTVTGHDQMSMRFSAIAGEARDIITETIPIEAPGSPTATATWGSTESLAKETVLIPSPKDAVAGSLAVTVSPSIAAYLPSGLEHVTNFPYGCAEQTASAFLPNVALSRLQGLDAFTIVDEKTLRTKVTAGLQTLYSFQRPDGGFGYWQGSTESHVPLTAYVLYALETAKTAGYAVDAGTLRRASDFLSNALRAKSSAVDDATRAYILFIFAETGRGDTNLALNLFERRKDLPVFSKAQLAMALARGNSTAATRSANTLLTDIENIIVKDGRGAHVEERGMSRYASLMQTNQRATALTLRAMLRIDPDHALIPDLLRWLLASRQGGHWDTTQSTTESLLALTEYLKDSGELNADFTAGVEINGKMSLTKKFTKANVRDKADVLLALEDLKRGAANELLIGKDGTGKLYYDLLLSTVSAELPKDAHEEGISITRSVRSLSSEAAATQGLLGDTYAVTLTMTVPQERHAVAVESPLPAGFEAIDSTLQTTAQTGEVADAIRKEQKRAWWVSDGNLWYFTHRELRDDRVFLFADTLPAGTYRYTYFVRATTPGTFRVRASRIWQMYQPEVFGSTPGELFTVGE